MATPAVCGSCGAAPRKGARFCDSCGAALVTSVTAAEYKQVTVLFADVVRSMDIAAAVDMERLREIMIEVVERSATALRRYGATVEYTGDGVMAIFGAPIAFEDHAFRACLAALAIQEEAHRLAGEVARRDGVVLRLRVGLNSGQVIAGEIGSGSLGYAATGEAVGLAQRMESVSPPGAVMLSESTARLVEHSVLLGEPQWVRIKGADDPASARQLMAITPRAGHAGRAEASLVGRRWEMAALEAMVHRAIGGRGGVVHFVGPPGIGKSRTAREAAALAAGRGVEVVWAFCESHAREVPFHTVTRLLRARTGVDDLDSDAARAKVRAQIPDADPHDLLLLDDLLGIADPEVPFPQIDPDARRRRLTTLINAASLARTAPALFIIEDAQWIDAVSELMLADFLAVITNTATMVLITSRPEYQGTLMRARGAQAIALGPLNDSDTAALVAELLGSDPSVGELAAIITERAAGNPFFVEEMVRELAQRGVLGGERCSYVCHTQTADVAVPATVQAAIEARIDRLTSPAKRTLNAASVIGASFGTDLLAELGIDAMVDELLGAELIDQVRLTPRAEYSFHHPLIRAVAYESQLKSDRAQWHRRLAAAIQERAPGSVDQNAALIAEHLEAAGEVRAAYGWHMRAAAWSTHRDIVAARTSWRRARQAADRLPQNDPEKTAMCIAPRTLLSATAFRVGGSPADTGFHELRDLCITAGDRQSLAIGMTGPVMSYLLSARRHDASRLASELIGLLESIDDPTLMIALSFVAIAAKHETAEMAEVLRVSQRVIDLADDDATRGNLLFESPLALATVMRGVARWCLGITGWRKDLDRAAMLARKSNTGTTSSAATIATVTWFTYIGAIPYGVILPDATALEDTRQALALADQTGDDLALDLARATRGITLFYQEGHQREASVALFAKTRKRALEGQFASVAIPVVDIHIAREKARLGDLDGAIELTRAVLNGSSDSGGWIWNALATGAVVEALIQRNDKGDFEAAQSALDRLASVQTDPGFVVNEITLLRLRALLAQACGDDAAYREWLEGYRAMATSLGFEVHIACADAMS